MFKNLRAINGARVSMKRSDERGDVKVPHIAQHATGNRWAEQHEVIVIDAFEDLDVSADKVSPFNRPDLKPLVLSDQVVSSRWVRTQR
ncbi:hypothetical protein AB0A63_13955 [Lentzea sp. NPDC042327]|uniref:hypothetical protein n=1 Tax=Lentzea sp. NPDC042327 TaxID=3154801 RepID=UPI0033DEEDD9